VLTLARIKPSILDAIELEPRRGGNRFNFAGFRTYSGKVERVLRKNRPAPKATFAPEFEIVNIRTNKQSGEKLETVRGGCSGGIAGIAGRKAVDRAL
jgi:hypothetical protein